MGSLSTLCPVRATRARTFPPRRNVLPLHHRDGTLCRAGFRSPLRRAGFRPHRTRPSISFSVRLSSPCAQEVDIQAISVVRIGEYTTNPGVWRVGFEPTWTGSRRLATKPLSMPPASQARCRGRSADDRVAYAASARTPVLAPSGTSTVAAHRGGSLPACTALDVQVTPLCDGRDVLPRGAFASGAGGKRAGEESNLQPRLRPGVDPWRRGVTDPVTCRAETPCSSVELPPHVQVAPHAVSHLELRCTSWRADCSIAAEAVPGYASSLYSITIPDYGDQVGSLGTDGVDLFPSSGRSGGTRRISRGPPFRVLMDLRRQRTHGRGRQDHVPRASPQAHESAVYAEASIYGIVKELGAGITSCPAVLASIEGRAWATIQLFVSRPDTTPA